MTMVTLNKVASAYAKAYPCVRGHRLKSSIWSSKLLHKAETVLLEKVVPHNFLVISATLRVETPWITIFISAKSKACSLR